MTNEQKQLQLDATDIENAKNLIALKEKEEMDACALEINEILQKHGYRIGARGVFADNSLNTEIFLIKS